MKKQQESDFLVQNFSDVPYKWPLEAYGMRGSIREEWKLTGCVEAYGRNGSLREAWKLTGCVEAGIQDAWRPAYRMRGSLRELAH